jgi:hypothetical protein
MAGDGSVRLVVGWLRETAPPPEALDGSAPSAA